MLDVIPSTQFRRDMKRMHRRNKNLEKLEEVVALLQLQTQLPDRYRDHQLSGNWSQHRECHIEPDWLLIYQVNEDEKALYMVRSGTHADLFGR